MHHSIVELPDAQLQAARLRSALRLRRHVVRELLRAARHADDAALHPPASAREEGSVARRSAIRSSRSSTTSIPARPSRSARRCSRARSWWNQAFEAAGYRNAFRVEMLPEGVSPLDIRYNVDQLGAPLDARLEHRRQRRRSAHRRDHQGRRRARLAARRAGLHDCRRAAQPVQDRRRNAAGARAVGARADAPARRARGRAHARPRPQLLRQRGRAASRCSTTRTRWSS